MLQEPAVNEKGWLYSFRGLLRIWLSVSIILFLGSGPVQAETSQPEILYTRSGSNLFSAALALSENDELFNYVEKAASPTAGKLLSMIAADKSEVMARAVAKSKDPKLQKNPKSEALKTYIKELAG